MPIRPTVSRTYALRLTSALLAGLFLVTQSFSSDAPATAEELQSSASEPAAHTHQDIEVSATAPAAEPARDGYTVTAAPAPRPAP
ncbi:MAG TPA: hypothetical protein VIQ26_07415, partial [Microbacteriaceae bacterium]